ncbi:hypothetical protein BpHYR1_028520, partial [Brachionus plicatilis]
TQKPPLLLHSERFQMVKILTQKFFIILDIFVFTIIFRINAISPPSTTYLSPISRASKGTVMRLTIFSISITCIERQNI